MPTGELSTGIIFGLLGIGFAAITRRWCLDWGLIWGASGLPALSLTSGAFANASMAFDSGWAWVVLLVGGGVAGLAMSSRHAGPLWPLALLASLIGVWAAVPDTELPTVLLGVTLPMIPAWFPLKAAIPARIGGLVIGVVTAFTIVVGGSGRVAPSVGAAGALAALALLPLCQRIMPKLADCQLLLVHLLVLLSWSRVAAIQASALDALAVGLGGTLVILGATRLIAGLGRKPSRSP